MKKILRFASALLCGAMLLCSLSVTAFAENDDEVYDFDPNTDKIYSETPEEPDDEPSQEEREQENVPCFNHKNNDLHNCA